MRKYLTRTAVLVAILSFAMPGFSDTLVLKTGEQISGLYEGGTSRIIRFLTDEGVREFDLLSVAEVRFGDDVVDSRPEIQTPPAAPPPAEAPPVRLRTPEESAVRPGSDNAANTAWTVPRGSSIFIQMIDSIDSETSRPGQIFTATLADPIKVEGIEVAPVGSDLRGRIVEVEGAGRMAGAAELRLELSQIVVNGIPYALTTAEYTEVGDNRVGETAGRMGKAAGVGALIGLIAGGGKGAAIGAGVGAGAAGAVQVLTKGEKLYIPAETLLSFTLKEPLVIAAR